MKLTRYGFLLLMALVGVGFGASAQSAEEVLPARKALATPEVVAHGLLTPRSALPCYASREEMQSGTSSLMVELKGWQVDSLPTGVRYTTRFKRNYRYDDKEIVLRIEGATAAVVVEVNDEEVAYAAAGRGRGEFDLTKRLRENNNTISITLLADYAAQAIEPDNGGVFTFDRALLLTPPRVAVADYTLSTKFNKQGDGLLSLGVVMQSFLLNSKEYDIYYELYDPEGKMVSSANKMLATRMLSRDTVSFYARIPKVKSWSPEEPNLYRLVVYTRHEKRIKEFTEAGIGFRTVELADGGVVLNGNALNINAVAATEDGSAEAVERLRKEGYNMIFVSRPVEDEFYDICDRVGMLVCPSADITCEGSERRDCPSNDPRWRESYIWRATANYHATKLHPSVVMFSIGHKAHNGICLYESYLAMKALKGESRPIVYPSAEGEWNTDL